MEKQLNSFLDFLQNNKKASENTLQSYRRDIVYYNKYLEANKDYLYNTSIKYLNTQSLQTINSILKVSIH